MLHFSFESELSLRLHRSPSPTVFQSSSVSLNVRSASKDVCTEFLMAFAASLARLQRGLPLNDEIFNRNKMSLP